MNHTNTQKSHVKPMMHTSEDRKVARKALCTGNTGSTWNKMRHALAQDAERGMSLVEVLIVLTIMASIMGMVGVFVVGALERANIKEAQTEIKSLESMADSYYTLSSPRKYPDSLEDLTKGPAPLTKKVPKDPWGNEYIYRKTGPRAIEILSAGPDGQEGGEDDVKSAE